MTSTPLSCDIFCAVVDNYGDAAVCWRLALQLSSEHGWRVRLWIDDPAPLKQLAPDHEDGPVDVRTWPKNWLAADAPDVVIEAFACNLPPACVEVMAARPTMPVWLNLEYLSAERWVAGCHALPSPHPRLPLVKHFFFPGFDAGTGGLLRERDYEVRYRQFDESTFRRELGLPARTDDELTISLFSYENPALPALLNAWAESDRPIRILRPGTPGPATTTGNLNLQPLPFLPQRRYDELLWSCDLNFVRGEDSFVRAQWSGKPFVWQIYPQEDNAHRIKLDAFLSIHPVGRQLEAFWHAWNGFGALDWNSFVRCLPALGEPMRQWAKGLANRPDLAAELVKFCLERLK